MQTIKIKDLSFKPFLAEDELQGLIRNVAQQINNDYKGKTPLFIGVLNGSFMFMGDLMKSIDLECLVSFVKLASYEGTVSTGAVNQLIGLNESLEGQDVIIVEDIIDSGLTLSYLRKNLMARQPASLEICAMFVKEGLQKTADKVKYEGFYIPPDFVIGYGLDAAEKLRGLPFLAEYLKD